MTKFITNVLYEFGHTAGLLKSILAFDKHTSEAGSSNIKIELRQGDQIRY